MRAGDGFDTAGPAVVDGGREQEFGVATAPGLGCGVEIEQVGPERLGVEEVKRKVGVEDAGCGDAGAVFFEEEADVALIGEPLA